jgi:signal transduction histidine kinase
MPVPAPRFARLRAAMRGNIVAIAGAAALLLLQIANPAPFDGLRLYLFDSWQAIAPRSNPARGAIIVGIDTPSLAEYGQWPWPRDLLARLVQRVAAGGASVIGLEILFAEADRLSPEQLAATLGAKDAELAGRLRTLPTNDSLLAESFAAGEVVLATATRQGGDAVPSASQRDTTIVENGADPLPFLSDQGGLVRGVPALNAAAAGRGDAGIEGERDGLVRRQAALCRVGSRLIPSIAIEMLRVAAGAEAIAVTADDGGIVAVDVAGHHLPTDRQGRMWLHYAPHDPSRFVSAQALLAGNAAPDLLRGRPVLIAATATGLSNALATPLGTPMTGAEIHAQLIDAILGDDLLVRPRAMLLAELALTVAAVLAVVGFGARVRARSLLLPIGALIAGLFALSFGAYALDGVLLDATYPAIAAGTLAILLLGQRLMREQKAREAREAKLRETLFKVETASRAKSEFLANMSHELRTPLTAIIGFSEILKLELFGPLSIPRYRGYAADIHASGTHLLDLVTDILDMARIEAGETQLHETALDIAAVIRDAERMVAIRAEAKKITIAIAIPADPPRLRADERLVRQMILNLVSNAVKFTPVGGSIGVGATIERDGKLAITITDTGIGIGPEDLDKVIKPFSVVESAMTSDFSGIGLGLPLTKSMIELHGGTLELTSTLGVGTTARLRFPADRIAPA